jgi:hypothetical protein
VYFSTMAGHIGEHIGQRRASPQPVAGG